MGLCFSKREEKQGHSPQVHLFQQRIPRQDVESTGEFYNKPKYQNNRIAQFKG